MGPLIRGFVGAVTIELRRPASAVACVGGFAVALAVALRGGSSAWPAAEILVGGLLAVAALGELPSGIILDAIRRRTGETLAWAAARALFPLAGVAAAAAIAQDIGLVTIAVAIVATASTQAVVHAAGGQGSEPATAALLLAVGAAVAASAGLPFAWLVAGWAAAAWAAGRLMRLIPGPERPTIARGRGRTVWLWPLPAQGRLRPAMTATAMTAGLVAMAAWLVPQPPRADSYAAVATLLFISLAVPQMTLADGIVDRSGWAAVLRPIGQWFRGRPDWPPAGRIAFAHAALFVWPLVVAGVLTVQLPGAPLAAALAVAGLLIVAAFAAGTTLVARRLGGSAETSQAIVLAFFAACCGWLGPHMGEFISGFAGSTP